MVLRFRYCLTSKEGGEMPVPWQEIVKKIDDYRWEIPTSYKAGMSVPGMSVGSLMPGACSVESKPSSIK